MKHLITLEEYEAINERLAKNKNKHVDRRLKVLKYRHEGLSDGEIANKLDYSKKRVSQLCREFKTKGLDEYVRQKQTGNHRNLPLKVEREVLADCLEKAEKGALVKAKVIQLALEEKLGKAVGKTYAYRVLHRHNWRKLSPRPQHHQVASAEEMEASKKLTLKRTK